MDQRRARLLLRLGAGASVFGAGVVGGVIVERPWYEPPRAALLADMERTVRAYEARLKARDPNELPEAPRLSRPPRPSR